VNGQSWGVQRRHRREIHLWTDEEWEAFRGAVIAMKEGGQYSEYARIHLQGLPMDRRELGNLQFLPWHRRFLHDFETDLQIAARDCNLTLPFWNPNLEASTEALWSSVVWRPDRLGGRPRCPNGTIGCENPELVGGELCPGSLRRWCLQGGLAAGWQVNFGSGATGSCSCVHRSPEPWAALTSLPVLMGVQLGQEDFQSFSASLDQFLAAVRCGIPGRESTMCPDATSTWDPLFYLVQGNVDHIFALWQRTRLLSTGEDTSNCPGCDQLMTHYSVPLSEWFGQHDMESDCVLLPRSAPVSCVSYQDTPTSTARVSSTTAQTVQGQDSEVESSSCDEAVARLESGECPPGELLTGFQRTCPVPAHQVAPGLCAAFYESMALMPEKDREEGKASCIAEANRSWELFKQRPYAEPSSQTEAQLCFTCHINCSRPRQEAPNSSAEQLLLDRKTPGPGPNRSRAATSTALPGTAGVAAESTAALATTGTSSAPSVLPGLNATTSQGQAAETNAASPLQEERGALPPTAPLRGSTTFRDLVGSSRVVPTTSMPLVSTRTTNATVAASTSAADASAQTTTGEIEGLFPAFLPP